MHQRHTTELKPPAPRADAPAPSPLSPTDTFIHRHIGPSDAEITEMLRTLGYNSLDDLTNATIPPSIRLTKPLTIGPPRGEHETLADLKQIASQNKVFRSFIGQGYYDTITPPVIQRNILENPGWYTQYTPYQAEISQGRLEALLNFQTMVEDLTALPVANASLLDESTAAAEAMFMCRSIHDGKRNTFFVADDCHPQTIAVVQNRAKWLGINCVVGKATEIPFTPDLSAILLQYPTTDGRIEDYSALTAKAHESGALVVVATDLLALTLIKPPGEWGADIAVGNTQRFGVPLGFGGPHAAFMATKHEYTRKMPGRLVGVSKDAQGNPAYRLAIQTREQHIRREKATSNICTAQVLLAIMAGMYAVYHGPDGLQRIALRIKRLREILAYGLGQLQFDDASVGFDSVAVNASADIADSIIERASSQQVNLRRITPEQIGISLDETTTYEDIDRVFRIFGMNVPEEHAVTVEKVIRLHECLEDDVAFSESLRRTSPYLTHPVFNTHHSETEMLRYIKSLESRDLSLTHSMIPLGSCTMKLNATSEMFPVTWPEFARIHPFTPPDQTQGYHKLFQDLERWLADITGFAAVSLQPNAGSQGEYAGLLAIRAYHESRNQSNRTICLIPDSAHGTNPASAIVAGLRVVPVAVTEQGHIDLTDLKAKAAQHAHDLACIMITYPSTRGVFEENIKDVCKIIHDHGGQVYMDGANMNAQVGLTSPATIGADVCHLNLHKTFCIPHGGGGPGMGPIAVAEHLKPFLPSFCILHSALCTDPVGPVSESPHGSALILTIPWTYISLMGTEGLTKATQVAILNANYMARRLAPHYPITYTGKANLVAHEFVMDVHQFEASAGVKAEDIAKRLMDYGFHAPTMSWPVPGTLMVEPTESESKAELDRFCDAMIHIRREIAAIEQGQMSRTDNPLKNAPHPAHVVTADAWPHPYPRSQAAYPAPWTKHHKFWPAVARIDNPYGDRNLVCACPPVDSYQM